MEKKKHRKHAKMARPDLGFFARSEWAILGTTCGNIKKLAFHLIEQLSDQYKVAYMDADHKSADQESVKNLERNNAMDFGASLEYTDKINRHRFDMNATLDQFQYRSFCNGEDAVLVNGNHFTARNQIVVIDERKLESLQRKTDRLTDIVLVLLEKGISEIPDFVKERMSEGTPVFRTEEQDKITIFLQQALKTAIPPVSGLVLAGGKSTRMGVDKGLITYRDKPHREYLYELLDSFCENTYISCRPDQVTELKSFPTLPDSFLDLGPFGALLSAFRKNPNHAWLVVACDYPLMNKATISQLMDNRNPSKIATAFNNPNNEFPEPLVTLWEPRSYFELLRFLGQGYSCPRKVLINSEVELLDVNEPNSLQNVNAPEDRERIMDLMKKG